MQNKITHSDIVNTAREWLGTPYHHQARVKGHGCDCAQLVIGVGQSCGVFEHYPKRYMKYNRSPRPKFIKDRLREFMVEIKKEEMKAGDVIYTGWTREHPCHLGILTSVGYRLCIIHASIKDGFVVESTLSREFYDMIDSFWRFKGL